MDKTNEILTRKNEREMEREKAIYNKIGKDTWVKNKCDRTEPFRWK